MKVFFQVAYKSVVGESLELQVEICTKEGKLEKQVVPMQWLDEFHWCIEQDFSERNILSLSYQYVLKREPFDVRLTEAGSPRSFRFQEPLCERIAFLDDWRSAGTHDRVYQAKLFRTSKELKPRSALLFREPKNHEFHLFLSFLPEGLVPCLLGSSEALGEWDGHRALPMLELTPNQWSVGVDLPTDQIIEYKYGFYDSSKKQVVRLEEESNRLLTPRQAADRLILSDENFRRNAEERFRAAGVAIPVFSLRSETGCGVGEFADLKAMGKWAAQVGLRLLQILPINDTTSTYTKSDNYPYSAISVFALHPLYLRLDEMSFPLEDLNFLASEKRRLNALKDVDYEQVMAVKWRLTREVFEAYFEKIRSDSAFLDFVERNRQWILDYAVFCVKRDEHRTAEFSKWGEWAAYDSQRVEVLSRDKEAIYYIWLQYELDLQLTDAVQDLRSRGIALKGDLPIGVDRNSVETWVAPHLFQMEMQAGAPPDAFTKKGQNWGFPTYNWSAMKQDGYSWWRSRLATLSRYFDAYRIDHILGFFRIWQIPIEQVEGIMGWFEPAIPLSLDDLEKRGISFNYARFCEPFLTREIIAHHFGQSADRVWNEFLIPNEKGQARLKDAFSTQRKVADYFDQHCPTHFPEPDKIRTGLMDLISNILFHEVKTNEKAAYHPRLMMEETSSFQALDADLQSKLRELSGDYFFLRQEAFWEAKALEKIPSLCRASDMLLCGEDLGMVPACVSGVMQALGILSLEIQRWPKFPGSEFGKPALCPYLSVVSTSTHDMSTLRGWWSEDAAARSRFAKEALHLDDAPEDLSADIASQILSQHMNSPAMWAIFPLQDLLACDEKLRSTDIDGERINIPAIIPFDWKWRMELSLEKLYEADGLNTQIQNLISMAGRS